MIIFLKSEIVKYQNEISSLKKNDYNSMIISLEEENNQLINEKKELTIELMKMKRTHEEEMNKLHEDIQSRENQRLKLISSIDALVKKKNELQEENRTLLDAMKESKSEETPKNFDWLQQFVTDYGQSIEKVHNTLYDFIQKNDEQLSTIKEELIKNRSEAIDINLYLLKEIKNKSNKIDMLMREIEELKEKHQKKVPSSIDNTVTKDSEALTQLDNKVQKVLSQAMNFEDQLDEKLRILDDLECKLTQIANEVEKQRNDTK